MQGPEHQKPVLDEATIAFAGRVFGFARLGAEAELRELLEQGMPPNLRNDKGDTLLMLASYHGHEGCVAALLDHGADAEIANDRGQTPLGGAVFKGFETIVRLLLDRGAAVDGSGGDGRTPLMLAAMFDRVAMIDLLLARGADPSARDANGLGAREAAEKMGALGAIARLSSSGD